ncbi:hypothetical protein OsI_09683 [Oryza sativa Indica Group]|uniref:Nascent polypeptide-associated complex subunit beta n=1 Tax=Oryza sativa subsp. indica TaxID=39946 RepID=A2XBM1_ORYSI|nr:hypothetical protein OsI_09683 [Oryza sativa Indica Group]
MDEDYLILPKDEPFFYQDDLNLCDPEGTAFPAPYIGELGLLHPTTLGGDDAEPEEAAAPSFPQFIGDLSAQPPPPTPGGSVKAAPQFIGDDVSAQPPYHNGAGEGSGLPPAMSSGMEEAAHLAPSNAPLHPFDDVFDLLEPFDEVPRPEETEELFAYALELDKGNDDQWILGAAHLDANPNQTPCSLLSQFDADSLLGTNHQTAIHNSAAATHQLVQEIPSSDTPPAREAADAMEMAELSRVADECGGEASMVWSSDEDELLLDGFSRLANQDSVSMCMEIAYGLPKKTAMDVALRIRWFQNKNKSAAQAGVISKESAGGNTEKAQAQAGVRSTESTVRKTRKGKGIENPNKKRNKHALSERGQDCMSTKALIRDNSMLLDQIYDKLSTGQLACAPSMFDKVKMNLDAILAKMRAMGVNTDEYKLDLEALEEIKQGFHPSMNVDKLKKMAGAVRTGGKGSMRRKKKAVHKTTTTDDKRLQSTLKRVGVNNIPGIEEVNIFKDDVVIQFQNPKVQASIGANTWVVSGTPQTKKLQDLLPTIINQLGPDNLDNLRRLAEQFQKQVPGVEAGASAGNAQDDDDDVPELVPGETFEEAAEEKKEPEEKKEAEAEEKKESS